MVERNPKSPYHHGHLREAMVEAAVAIVAEGGVEALTVREAARRAGVSSGAPFRHFSGKPALVAAVAEDGMGRLRAAIEAALAECGSTHPLVRMLAIGGAYLDWAMSHPTHYRVLGDRTQIDWAASETLPRDNRWIREQMLDLFAQARSEGLLREVDIGVLNLQTRAMAYGLARMFVDGHLGEFGIAPEQARRALIGAIRDFLINCASDPAAARAVLA
jgi:AcrR family transcriptional regulator